MQQTPRILPGKFEGDGPERIEREGAGKRDGDARSDVPRQQRGRVAEISPIEEARDVAPCRMSSGVPQRKQHHYGYHTHDKRDPTARGPLVAQLGDHGVLCEHGYRRADAHQKATNPEHAAGVIEVERVFRGPGRDGDPTGEERESITLDLGCVNTACSAYPQAKHNDATQEQNVAHR